MARLPGSTPSNYATAVTFARARNLHYPGDSLTVTATVTGGGACTAATGWEARDLTGTLIASGTWNGTTTQTIGTAGTSPFDKYGWLRFKLTGPDRGDGAWASDYGTATLAISEDVSFLPQAALRSSNPQGPTGLDDPYAHGIFGLGGGRISLLAQNLVSNRQQNGATATAATSVSTTVPTYQTTTASQLVLVWCIIGDDTGAAGPAGWTLDGHQSQGSGSTKVSVYVYRLFGQISLHATLTCTTTNAANHTLHFTELGPYLTNTAPLAITFVPGTGSTVAISKDMTGIATYEYAVLTGVAANGGLTGVTQTSSPALTEAWATGNVPYATQDGFGSAESHTITYTLGASADYVGFFIAYAGDPNGYGAYTTAAAHSALDLWQTNWAQYADPARPYRKISIAVLGSTSASAVTNYAAKIAQIVGDTWAYVTGLVGCYTGRNEPSGFTLGEAEALTAAVQNGNASAVAGGPNLNSMNFAYQSGFFTLCDAGIFTTGGLAALPYHDYNMCDGDAANTLSILRTLKSGLASRSLDTLPIYMTEGGYETTYWPGILRVPQSGAAYMLNMVAREIILGVPYEHQAWYYDHRGGYDNVTTWESTDGGPYPGWVMHRAYARELYGKTLESEISFDAHTGQFCLAGVWRNATDQTAVLALIGCTGQPDISFYVTGSPSSLTTVDCFGNTGTVAVTAGVFTLTPSDLIQYVRLPANAQVTARTVTRGVNFLRVAFTTISDSGDTGSATVAKTLDGVLLSPYAYNTSNPSSGGIYETANNTFPRTITYTPTIPAVTVDTLALKCPPAWQNMGAILKGKLEYTTDGSTWVQAGSWDISATVTLKNYDLYSDTLADAYTLPQHYWEFDLGSEVAIQGVRLTITSASQGMYLDSMMSDPTGTTNAVTTGSVPISAAIAEVFAFSKAANVPHPAMT